MKSTDHILWFFSTCAQTFAALVGVFGMFVLYRLQIEEGRIGSLRERMFRYDDVYLKLPFDVVLEKLGLLKDEHLERAEGHLSESIVTLLGDYQGATGKRAWLSRRARRPIIALVLLTFWSLAGLVLYPYFVKTNTGAILMWATLAACLVPLYQIASIISVSLSLE